MGHEAINFGMSELGNALNDELAQTNLINALMSLQNLARNQADLLEKFPPSVRKRVEILKEIQGQYDELEAKFMEERAAVLAKYQKLYEPLQAKRCDIVNGTEAEGKDDAEEILGVPDFWLTALKNNPVVGEKITEGDKGVLKYLKDVKSCRLEEQKGFKLEFYFDTNPFFKNTVLTKTYYMIDEDEPVILEKAIGTEIEWFPGKKLTKKFKDIEETENAEQIPETDEEKEGSNNAEQIPETEDKEESKSAEPITDQDKEESKNKAESTAEAEEEDCESFLIKFFNPPQVPDDDEEIDKDGVEELQNKMEQDYYIGSTIRVKIVPHAVSLFTGEAIQPIYDLEIDTVLDIYF
ncbi:Nucleosome assembly protein (NAP) [Corchorus capsularis]|uniref:Nucleosome assembly protein (NAP) n=1 Tax=Corchorus capsularis TaxID=210143 RepID=A0A1R3I2B9_COCAP|nr:Nucleosome assembly protein (NAP) [Corchorus capsularis]